MVAGWCSSTTGAPSGGSPMPTSACNDSAMPSTSNPGPRLADDAGTLSKRADAIGRDLDEDLVVNGLAGTVEQAREKVGQFAERGVERLYLQVLDLADLDHLDELATLMEP